MRDTCSWQPLVLLLFYAKFDNNVWLHASFKPQKMKTIFFFCVHVYVQNIRTNVSGLGNFSSPDLKGHLSLYHHMVSVVSVYFPLIKKAFPSKTSGSIKIKQISCISYGLWDKTWQKWAKKCQFPNLNVLYFIQL